MLRVAHSTTCALRHAAAASAAATTCSLPARNFTAAPSHAAAAAASASAPAAKRAHKPANASHNTSPAPPASSPSARAAAPSSNSAARSAAAESSSSAATPAASAAAAAPHPARLSPVWSWGAGHTAALGLGHYRGQSFPHPLHALADRDVVSLSGSWARHAAVTRGGAIYQWGWRPAMRSLLHAAKWHRRLPRAVEALQRLGMGRWTLNGAEPLVPARVPGWGIEPDDPAEMLPEGGDEPLRAVSVSAGADWLAVLDSEGQVYTWGAGSNIILRHRHPRWLQCFYGQMGHSSHISDTLLTQPTLVSHYQNHHPNESHGRKLESNRDLARSFPNSPIRQVACGFSHMLLLTEHGQVYACGKCDTGALGITHIYRDGKRLFFPHLIPVTDAFAAGEHGAGEVGIKLQSVEKNEAEDSQFLRAQNDPSIVDSFVGPMVQVAAGMKHSLFLNASGEVYACGNNGLGELGNGTFHPLHGLTRVKLPLTRPFASTSGSPGRRRGAAASNAEDTNEGFFSSSSFAAEKIVKISAGMHHSLALSSLGHVYAWGLNRQGQCGVPCVTKNKLAWLGGTVSMKRSGSRSAAAHPDEAEASADSTASGGGGVRGLLHRHESRQSAINAARAEQMREECILPTRIRINEAELGISKQQLGTVVDIIAGFYDSVLITDRGYCIMFGGGLSATGQHRPYIFRLDRPVPSGGVMLPHGVVTHPPEDPTVRASAAQPARIRHISFGLGHALALLEQRPLR